MQNLVYDPSHPASPRAANSSPLLMHPVNI